jgi:ornithine carbamoyltransferase
MYNLRNRSLLKEIDFSRDELLHLLALSQALKTAKYAGNEVQRLAGKEIALIFEKASTRTRCAFEVAAFDQGAHVTYLDPTGSQLGHKESIADTARVLGRMFDAIEYRGSGQENVEELARHAGVPVYNGLTDEWHPTQMLADFLTMHERTSKPYDEIAYAFVGDGRFNMGRSLLITGAIMGSDVRLVTPTDLRPPQDVIDMAHELAAASGARITITDDVGGVHGADFVHTDVWVSMGEPKEVWTERAKLLAPYQVNTELLAATSNPKVKFMHCLPAFHNAETTVGRDIADATGMTNGLEVTDEVFQSPASIVFDQAENRLHTIKAVLVATLA